MRFDEDELPVGEATSVFAATHPARTNLEGRYCRLAPLDPATHSQSLFEGTSGPGNEHLWRYLSYGPFTDRLAFERDVQLKADSIDPLYFAITDSTTARAIGWTALLRIDTVHRCIEIGHVLYTQALQKTRVATEAMYLLACYVFDDLGYRRYEWKCNAFNAASRRAALRLGFTFEGIFRQHMIVKGRNRDSAWFSMLDSEWPLRKARFDRWLNLGNFDAAGRQKTPLDVRGHGDEVRGENASQEHIREPRG